MNKERLRKSLVIAFLIWGGAGMIYELNQPEPILVKGTGSGFNDDLVVSLTLTPRDNGYKITGIEIDHCDTPMIADSALEELKRQVLIKQTHDIDEISGATYTSQGFIEAAEDALKQINK